MGPLNLTSCVVDRLLIAMLKKKKKLYIGDSEYKMAITVLLLFICQSRSLVNMYYCRLPVQAQPWQMLTGPRPPAAVATGEGLAGWAERTAWLCVGGVGGPPPDVSNNRSTVVVRHKHKPFFFIERTPYSCRSHGNS